ncbi:MAG: uracil-DNA glycosylase [Candidatus Bathyarchaeia archaeon]
MKTLEDLNEKVKVCRKCSLWKNRKYPVFGEGPEDAEIMLIGLGPGYNENLQGRPFVGAAGRFLDELLSLINLKREEIYITNVIKCYLPNNKPTENQIKTCTSNYLNKQMYTIEARIIITLGNIATEYAFRKFNLSVMPMSEIHGKCFKLSSSSNVKVLIPMYHPAAALRNPKLKNLIIEDWRTLEPILKDFKPHLN